MLLKKNIFKSTFRLKKKLFDPIKDQTDTRLLNVT